jgi:Uma2 family endonuclease
METALELEEILLEEDLRLEEDEYDGYTEHIFEEDEEDDEMPNFVHGRLQFGLLQQCNSSLRENYMAYPPITFKGEAHRYTPDVVIYPRRTTPLADEPVLERVPPIIAVEIISTGQTMSAMVKKCREMLANGVEECWILEPANETVTVCRAEHLFALHRGESIQQRLLTRPLSVDEMFDV